MKKLIHFFSFLLLVINSRAAVIDTIDFWKIELTSKEIYPHRNYDEKARILSAAIYALDSIAPNDFLDISYFTDTPCHSCPSKLELRDSTGKVLKTIENTFDWSPFRLTGSEVKTLLQENKNVYLYFTGQYKDWRPWQLLGVLKMKNARFGK